MPSAAAKVAAPQAPIKTPDLLHEPVKNVVSVLEKKLRNLEKRKIKLVETKRKAEQGSELNEDQKKALENLVLVENGLTTVREVHKTLTALDVEYSKLLKREQKRTKQEQKVRLENCTLESVCGTIQIQAILGELSDEIRPDFLNGTNGACELTSEELANLDAFYELINLSPDDKPKVNFSTHVNQVGVHLWNLSEGKDKEVLENVTYKQLKETLTKIQESGYFDKDDTVENEPEEEGEAVEEEQEEEVELVKVGEEALEAESGPVPSAEDHHEEELVAPAIEPCAEIFLESPVTEVQPPSEPPVVHMEAMNGVDLPPEVQQMEQTPDNEKIDFMGESEIPPAMLESQQLSLNPVSPEFIPRNMLPVADEGNGWSEPMTTPEWNETSNADNEWQQEFTPTNQQVNASGSFRGRGGRGGGNRGGGYGGRGRGRGGSGGGNFRGSRQDNYRDGNYRGGNRGNRGGGGNRVPRGAPRGGPRGTGRGFGGGGGGFTNRTSAPQ